MRFLSATSDLLASCDESGLVLVHRIYEAGDEAAIEVRQRGGAVCWG